MRIIAGTLKGRRLQAPPPGDLSIRPTSDRAREALFSILQSRPAGPFLDLFAGTGAVGLEALSRGHRPVTCVESSPKALALLEANARGTGLAVLRADACALSATAFQGLDIVFADPPYAASSDLFRRLGTRIAPWLRLGGLLVWEDEAGTPEPEWTGFEVLDVRRYGAARFHFLRVQ